MYIVGTVDDRKMLVHGEQSVPVRGAGGGGEFSLLDAVEKPRELGRGEAGATECCRDNGGVC